MLELNCIQDELNLVKSQLKNIRQALMKQRVIFKKEVQEINVLLEPVILPNLALMQQKCDDKISYNMKPIGIFTSCFVTKNGIPRQASLCTSAKGMLKIDKTVFTNPAHSLIGLEEFSHLWILFVFHKNSAVENFTKAKVHPPRLNGKSIGVFSTRSPHRPNSIGLSLVQLDKVEGSTLYLSGIDLLDGTPILDIKPYISSYDVPFSKKIPFQERNEEANNFVKKCSEKSTSSCSESLSELSNDKIIKDAAAWFKNPPVSSLEVSFTARALTNIKKFHSFESHAQKCEFCLMFFSDSEQAAQAILDILQNDPRSVYRRQTCSDKLYYVFLDSMHITCWFDNDLAEVLKVQPASKASCKSSKSDSEK